MEKNLSEEYGFLESRREEIASSIIHGIGALLSIAALSLLVVFASLWGDVWKVVSFSIYGASLLILYLSSTFYHLAKDIRIKRKLQIFDHSAVFLLIAGTYTPFMLVTLRGPWGWSLFGVIWGLALVGIIFKFFFTAGKYDLISSIIYIVMGWIIVIAIGPIVNALSAGGIAWLFIGGGLYTLGTVFFLWERIPFNHAIWHVFVLAASIVHFFGILFHVLPA